MESNDDFSPEVTKFADYVTETWVEGQSFSTWNHFDTEGPRTTNHVEGWHGKVNKICRHAHPNIYAMLTLLQSMQATNEAKMIQLVAGGKVRKRRKVYIELDTRLQQLKTRYLNGQLGLLEYADAASHLIKLK
jgi:hypothetical protein